jgi:hypothetical protein
MLKTFGKKVEATFLYEASHNEIESFSIIEWDLNKEKTSGMFRIVITYSEY